jgi:hypothetical protein
LVSIISAEGEIGSILAVLYTLGLLGAVGAIAIVIEAVLRVLRGPGGWLVRGGETVLGLSALFALWAIWNYGLASFSFTY